MTRKTSTFLPILPVMETDVQRSQEICAEESRNMVMARGGSRNSSNRGQAAEREFGSLLVSPYLLWVA